MLRRFYNVYVCTRVSIFAGRNNGSLLTTDVPSWLEVAIDEYRALKRKMIR